MAEKENKVKEPDKKTLNRQGSEFWLQWPKPGEMSSPKKKRSRKLFTKSVFVSDSDKIAVTVAQMSKSIDGSLDETAKASNIPKIVITPATYGKKSTTCHNQSEKVNANNLKINAGSAKSTPVELLQCLAAPSSPSSDNVYMLASKGKNTSH